MRSGVKKILLYEDVLQEMCVGISMHVYLAGSCLHSDTVQVMPAGSVQLGHCGGHVTTTRHVMISRGEPE